MNPSAPIFLIIAAIGGFTSGALLDGEVEPHSFQVPVIKIPNNFDNDQMTFIQSAQMSVQGQAIIDHAFIDFNFETIEENGFFENVLNQCIFMSGQSFGGEIFTGDMNSMDNGVCILCKIKGECMDVHADFVDLPHGTRLGAINAHLGTNGIFLSVNALGNGHNTAIIFDGDTPGGSIDTDDEPDPDLRADGNQADANDLDGICAECAGMHMLIIPERLDDVDFDNLVDTPDDSADGGTMKFQFEVPRRIVSFNFTDMDRENAAVHEARAYSDFSCTQLIGSAVSIPIPVPASDGDGDVQIIYMNKDNARCLEIEAHDSFGVSDLVVECMKIEMDGKILGEGRINLPQGYTQDEKIIIPIDPPISVFSPQKVDLKILSTNLNYHGLNHGDVLNDQFLAAFGIKISGNVTISGMNQTRDPVVFDTELSSTSDPDLEVGVGNISIVQENTSNCNTGTCSDPDDNAAGGVQYFQFDPKRYVNSLIWIDADRPEPFGTIYLFRNYDCTDLIDQGTVNGGINIPFLGDGSVQVLVPINVDKVGCMAANYKDSGGLSKINLGCPLPEDPITMPWFKGEHQGSSTEESIFFADFEDPWEIDEWSSTNSVSGAYFDTILEGGDWLAFAGSYVLAGWGSFSPEVSYTRTPIDISGYTNVVVSVHYSYEDTENADAFFFEYKDGSNWVKIIDIPSPEMSSGQFVWTLAEENIPNSINSLEFRFTWTTSSNSEHVMIDNLEVFGIPI